MNHTIYISTKDKKTPLGNLFLFFLIIKICWSVLPSNQKTKEQLHTRTVVHCWLHKYHSMHVPHTWHSVCWSRQYQNTARLTLYRHVPPRISSIKTLTVPNPPIWIRFCTHPRGLGLLMLQPHPTTVNSAVLLRHCVPCNCFRYM